MRELSPTAKYLLKALVPYSQANLKIAYKPKSFFADLEKKSNYKERTLRSAYYRAIKSGLIEIDYMGQPRLTRKGRERVKPYKPTKLSKDSFLLISFDIPESERTKRNHLRTLLRELSCTKIHQSLWYTKYDYRQLLAAEIKEYGLEDFVLVFEAAKLKIN